MKAFNKDITLQQLKHTLPFFLALIAAGLAGNYFKFPIFLNIDFLFGSIFALLVLQFFGLGRGIMAAALIAGYTWFLWNHPYAIIILTAEAAVVGWLMERQKMGMVMADTIYWLLIGTPLGYLFYHVVMHVPLSTAYFFLTKEAVNGIANALVARLIFTGFTLRSRSTLTSYKEIVYNLLAFFVLCPALLMLAVGSRTDFAETDLRIRTLLRQDIGQQALRLETWVKNRKSAILNLAEMAASRSPQQMQSYLEQAKKSDINFLRGGLLDREATITAHYPLIDELGQKNIGRNFADRPHIPTLKRTLQPMLSEVVMGRIGTPKPMVAMLAPVVIQGEYGGYVTGTLSLEQIREHLDTNTNGNAPLYTLLDKNGNVIMTNRTDQTVMTPFGRGQGTLNRLDDKGISQWVPMLPPNTPIAERWRNSFYIAEAAIGDLAEWKLILEQPVAPFQKTLYDNYTGKLTLLFLILLGALALAEFLSRKIVVTLEKLRTLTHALPVRLATDGEEIAWPESGIEEANHLINNFREMANSLSELFIEIRQINESLEQRVEERTSKLTNITHELSIILENAPVVISKIIDRQQVWVNRKTEDVFQYSKEEMEFQTTRKLYPSDEAYEKLGQEAYPALAQGLVFETVQELIRKDGVHILVRYIGKALEPPDMSKGIIWLLEDVTDRKRVEADKEKLEAQNRQLQKAESLGRMAGAIAHTFNNQLGVVIGNLELALMDLPPGAGPVYSLTAAMQAAGKAAAVSGQMLTYLGQSFDKHELLDLAEVCRRNLPIIRAGMPGKVVLETDLPSPGPTVMANENHIQQLLTNLITNAWEAVGEGPGAIHLSIKTVSPEDIPAAHCYPIDWQPQDNAYACLEVTDGGCGIADKDIENLFDPFFSSKFTGRGLGLPVVLGIVKAHDGAVTVESEPGRGSAFRVFLPVSAAELPRQTNQAVLIPERSGSGTILLVEDEAMLRDVAAVILRGQGFTVLEARDGVEAVEVFRQRRDEIRLVLCDLTMPRLNGWETLTALRKLAPDLPVILASGYDKAQLMAGDHPEWPQVFLGKPYKLKELSDAISQALVNRK